MVLNLIEWVIAAKKDVEIILSSLEQSDKERRMYQQSKRRKTGSATIVHWDSPRFVTVIHDDFTARPAVPADSETTRSPSIIDMDFEVEESLDEPES